MRPPKHPFSDHHNIPQHSKNDKSGVEVFISDVALTVGFGVAWSLTGFFFFIFPMVFGGIIPGIKGLLTMIRNIKNKKNIPGNNEALASKEILKVAEEEKGKVTPTMIALKTDLTLEQAEKILEKMVSKGYAQMDVTNSGKIEYTFVDLLKE
jgi:hypothetical protein